MGFKFRKSFKIAPGVKVNFNKKSTGITFGDKGIHYTVNSKGKQTKSVGIPGTGLYYTETSTSKKKQKRDKTTNQNPEKKEEKLMNTKKWYQKSWFTILMLIFFFPVGIYLMWKHTNWNKIVKIVITAFFALILSAALFSDNSEPTTETGNDITTTDISNTITTEQKSSTTKSTTTEATTEEPTTETTTEEITTQNTTKETTTQITTEETTTITTTETTTVTTTETTTEVITTRETTTEPTIKATTKYVPPVVENDEIVYITNTGTKYHNYGCRYLKSVIEISLDDAIADGYTPCGVCH